MWSTILLYARLIYHSTAILKALPAIIGLIRILEEADVVDDATGEKIVDVLEVLERIHPSVPASGITTATTTDLPETPGGA